jgi:hypothetical protein
VSEVVASFYRILPHFLADFEAYAAAATAPRFVLEKFLQNVADKLVYWAMSFLQVAGVRPEDFPRASAAEADSFDSLFDSPPDQQPYPIDDYIELEPEASLSTLEQSSEVEPEEVEILAEDFTENAESEEVGSERVEEEAEPEGPEEAEPKPSDPEIEEAEPESDHTESEGSHQSLNDTVQETPTTARRSSQMSDFVRRSVQKLEQDLNPEDAENK